MSKMVGRGKTKKWSLNYKYIYGGKEDGEKETNKEEIRCEKRQSTLQVDSNTTKRKS